jgi:diguanylate cyclase
MDSLTNPIFFVGIASGFCTLLFGVWVGTRIGRSRERTSAQALRDRLQTMAQQLASMTNNMGSDVRSYNGRINDFQTQVNGIRNAREQRVARNELAQAEDEVAVLLQAILQVNEGMKQRLDETEARLESHAQAMQCYITEARTDALTGLNNRRVLDQAIDKIYLDGTRGSQQEVSFVLLDVDHFKKFNDQHGHQAGDEVLKEVGKRMRENAYGATCVARYGGEEFAAVLPFGLERACKIAEEIRAAINAQPIVVDGKELRISASLGVALCESSEKPKSWVRRSDTALYAAKGMGRNIVSYYYGGNCLPFGERAKSVPETPVVASQNNTPVKPLQESLVEVAINKVSAAAPIIPTAAEPKAVVRPAGIDMVATSEIIASPSKANAAASVSSPTSTEPVRSAEEALQAEVELLKLEAAKAKVQRRLDAIVREESQRR